MGESSSWGGSKLYAEGLILGGGLVVDKGLLVGKGLILERRGLVDGERERERKRQRRSENRERERANVFEFSNMVRFWHFQLAKTSTHFDFSSPKSRIRCKT